jgi:hypothetical protein
MIKIGAKFFAVLLATLIQSTVFCINSSGSETIVAAINNLTDTTINNTFEIMNTIQGSEQNSIVNTLNSIFVSYGNVTGANNTILPGPGILERKLDYYIKNFFNFYLKGSTSNSSESNVTIAQIPPTSSPNLTDLITIEQNVNRDVKSMLIGEISYDTQSDAYRRSLDAAALLFVPAEVPFNNIGNYPSLANITAIYNGINNGSPFGSFSNFMISGNATISMGTAYAGIMDVSSIMTTNLTNGSDEYNNAILFLTQVMQSAPPPKIFYFPDSNTTAGTSYDKNYPGSITIYLPYATNGSSYTPCTFSNGSDYQNMRQTLKRKNTFVQYKARIRSKIALRSIFLEPFLRIFSERQKNQASDLSLAEREKNMATIGLTKPYYDNFANGSTADVQMEMLHTLNKVVYFLYKLHLDNERAQLLTAAADLSLQLMDSQQDETKYIRPISQYITGKCYSNPSGGSCNMS